MKRRKHGAPGPYEDPVSSRMTKDTFIQSLRGSVPRFEINSEWAAESLCYPIINDLARHICSQAECGNEETKSALDFLERCLKEGDPYIRDLVHECLETLVSCNRIPQIKMLLGPQTQNFWNRYFNA